MWKTRATVIGSYGNSGRFLACKSPMYMFAAELDVHTRRAVHPAGVTSPQHWHPQHTLTGWLQTFIATLRTENRGSLMCHKQSMPFIASLSAAALGPWNGGRVSYPGTNQVWRGADNLTDAVDRFGALCHQRQKMSERAGQHSKCRPCCSCVLFRTR